MRILFQDKNRFSDIQTKLKVTFFATDSKELLSKFIISDKPVNLEFLIR
jgi:hypothetical protein